MRRRGIERRRRGEERRGGRRRHRRSFELIHMVNAYFVWMCSRVWSKHEQKTEMVKHTRKHLKDNIVIKKITIYSDACHMV